MGIEALTKTSDGRIIIPSTEEEWRGWVSASAGWNYMMKDPLLDWLDLYGEANGFQRDDHLGSHDPRTDFTTFIMEKGRRFEEAVVEYLGELVPITTISEGPAEVRDLSKAEETFAAMQNGAPAIYQGVLRDAESRTYGAPDLLVRSDELQRLFPGVLGEEEASDSAPGLGFWPWHYRVVDIKFTTIGLLAGGEVSNSGSKLAYKAQLFVYNRALGRLQGYTPSHSYLLGRGWTQRGDRGDSFMERLGPVSQHAKTRSNSIEELAHEACEWLRRVRSHGSGWKVLPFPDVPDLWPNMGNTRDDPWHGAKGRIAEELGELTMLWQVGVKNRQAGHESGVYDWRDASCTADLLGFTKGTRQPVLQAIMEINRSTAGPNVQPSRVRNSDPVWRDTALEFYVDFETVSDLDDDFSKLPSKGGQPLIFMIGCGHVENGLWVYESFTVDNLTEPSEERIIDAWHAHMAEVIQRLGEPGKEPLIIHWSHAETSTMETSYNSAVKRHTDKSWPKLRWFDFLSSVMRSEPVVVRGAMNFGLKSVARAMKSHGYIETTWQDGPTDGLGAMVGAWWSAGEAKRLGVDMTQVDLMGEIQRYNEVDCKVMMEIAAYLRANH